MSGNTSHTKQLIDMANIYQVADHAYPDDKPGKYLVCDLSGYDRHQLSPLCEQIRLEMNQVHELGELLSSSRNAVRKNFIHSCVSQDLLARDFEREVLALERKLAGIYGDMQRMTLKCLDRMLELSKEKLQKRTEGLS